MCLRKNVFVRDGENHNLSWNCGEEGETNTPGVRRLRARQMRNLAAALLLSHGTPMILMGDEYGHSKASIPTCPSRSWVPNTSDQHLHWRRVSVLPQEVKMCRRSSFLWMLQGGNNNTYCHDSDLNWFNWKQAAEDNTGYARFFQHLIHFR